jgi:ribosomal protein S18 acetylase RimI-like enzyme
VTDIAIRKARPDDIPTLHQFVVDLADAEDFPGAVEAQPENLADALFGPRSLAEAALASDPESGSPVGFALYYQTYSTITGRPTLHLEDLYVTPDDRNRGIGLALLRYLAGEAIRRDCGRFEWWVLTSNEPAIRFYERLGAWAVDEIDVMRLDGDALVEFADPTQQ